MTFAVHYLVPAAGLLPVPDGDDVLVFDATLAVGAGERTVVFSVFAEGAGLRIATDLDYTALLRREPAEVGAVAAVDAWVLERAPRAIRLHELLLDVLPPRADAERWLAARDPAGDYWRVLGRPR
ncbi:hypothetical protein [Micromonospora sp. NPDC047730]|uniref:hypothetical protein n=1 Tax=Micromonospora sp. NPDC047730 TaxID=3364253 RepID=UPI0037204C3F